MKLLLLAITLLMAAVEASYGQDKPAASPAPSRTKAEQELVDLSRQKWLWMAERNVKALEPLFHEQAVFVHMGGNMSRNVELDVIKSGKIHYKQADVQDVSVRIIGTTAIVLSRIRLLAVVGGNEVTNPFMVTEVYLQQGGSWKLAQLSFSRLMGQ
jgi:hypothetical protein